ncbi:hypothetical protein GQ600_7517 [Phytophthora cactorum]|nr:hypothetical protein GQ600_7517 [Phytophthora cactorum]
MNPNGWTCSCIFRVTRLLPCRHIIDYRKVTSCDSLVPESIIHPRWLVKNYRRLRHGNIADDELALPYKVRTIPKSSMGRAKSQNEKFKEFSVLADNCRCVKAGHCPIVIVCEDAEANLTRQGEAEEKQCETELQSDSGATNKVRHS